MKLNWEINKICNHFWGEKLSVIV